MEIYNCLPVRSNVPKPHGRLIDADALIAASRESTEAVMARTDDPFLHATWQALQKHLENALSSAPTVVGPEGEGEVP